MDRLYLLPIDALVARAPVEDLAELELPDGGAQHAGASTSNRLVTFTRPAGSTEVQIHAPSYGLFYGRTLHGAMCEQMKRIRVQACQKSAVRDRDLMDDGTTGPCQHGSPFEGFERAGVVPLHLLQHSERLERGDVVGFGRSRENPGHTHAIRPSFHHRLSPARSQRFHVRVRSVVIVFCGGVVVRFGGNILVNLSLGTSALPRCAVRHGTLDEGPTPPGGGKGEGRDVICVSNSSFPVCFYLYGRKNWENKQTSSLGSIHHPPPVPPAPDLSPRMAARPRKGWLQSSLNSTSRKYVSSAKIAVRQARHTPTRELAMEALRGRYVNTWERI